MIKCLLPQKEDSNPWGGHSPEKRVWVCAAFNTPFSRLSCRSQDPRLRFKSVHKILIWKIDIKWCLQNQQFLEKRAIFSSRNSYFIPILVKKLRNLILSVLNPLFFDESPLTSSTLSAHKPPSSEIQAAHTYMKKVECPTPGQGEGIYLERGYRDVWQ